MNRLFLCLFLSAFVADGLAQERGTVIIDDLLRFPVSAYVPAYLESASGGAQTLLAEGMQLSVSAPGTAYGLYNKTVVSGHFYAEATFDSDDGASLALVKEEDGAPDFTNFTSLSFTTEASVVWVSVHDRQNGVDDVYDCKNKAPRDSYRYPLTNDRYSVNVDKTNKRMRIFHDGLANTWHFYFEITKRVDGQSMVGWLEMKPSPDWNPTGSRFFVMPCVRSTSAGPATVVCSQLRVLNKPVHDQDDRQTGFKAGRREVSWSGFSGDGIVLTFGKHFPFSKEDVKFMFWSEANYVPGWRMNDQLFTMYEFVEQGLSPRGCEEPMADRLLRWSQVDVVEDNAVRKTVRWHYVLNNPEYKTVQEEIGTQRPEVDEYYTFYPDGAGVRRVVFKPKMDGTEFGPWHELGETHVTAGSTTIPGEHLASPALSIANLQGEVDQYHPTPKKWTSGMYEKWPQIAFVTHCKTAPDPFIVFSHSPDVPETYSHYPLEAEVSWHSPEMAMTHFPVNREQYDDDIKSNATWLRVMPVRASLANIGINRPEDASGWLDHFKIDARDGRKYREWLALVGVTPNGGDVSPVRSSAQTWLYPGTVTVLEGGFEFVKNDVFLRQLVFNRNSGDACRFQIDPRSKGTTIVNPVFCFRNWTAGTFTVKQNGRALVHGEDYEYAQSGGELLVWVKANSSAPLTFDLAAKPAPAAEGSPSLPARGRGGEQRSM